MCHLSLESFLVKIDNNPENIWDLNPTGDSALYNVWRQDEVSSRGAGTIDAPQFDPLKINFTTGLHSITISGRELNARLAYFYLISTETKITKFELNNNRHRLYPRHRLYQRHLAQLLVPPVALSRQSNLLSIPPVLALRSRSQQATAIGEHNS